MNLRRWTPIVCTVWIAFSSPVAVRANPYSLLAEVKSVGRAMDRAMVEDNLEATLAYYADNAVVLPNYGPKLVGKEAIRRKLEADRTAGLRYARFEGMAEEAWECEDRIYIVGRFALTLTLPGADRPVDDRGKFFSVWERTPQGGVRIVYDIWNSDGPPGQPAPAEH